MLLVAEYRVVKKCIKTGLICLLLLTFLLLSSCSSHQTLSSKPEVTKITFWHGINPPENRVIFQELVDKFNQSNLDLEVESLYIGQPDTQLPKILAATE
jgi:multiple sugar transport system substrate-binding protein